MVPRTVLLLGTRPEQQASVTPGLGIPAFSTVLLGALRGWADADRDGDIAAGEVRDYARKLYAQLSLPGDPVLVGEDAIVLTQDARERAPKRTFEGLARGLEPTSMAPPVCAAGRERAGDACCWAGQSVNPRTRQCEGSSARCPTHHAPGATGACIRRAAHIDALESSCAAKDEQACAMLGHATAYGLGLPADLDAGTTLLAASCPRGHAPSCLERALLELERGPGIADAGFVA